MKRYMLFIFFSLLFSVIASSATILEFEETDYINLRPKAVDQDNDSLSYYFDRPLTTEGTWQTTYGDEGVYNTKVSVTDGRLVTQKNITLIVNKKEESPQISILAPQGEHIYIEESKSIFFNIQASDLNKDDLSTEWFLDGEKVSEGNYFTYASDFYSQGNHTIAVEVHDGVNTVAQSWEVEVQDVDRTLLLDEFKSMTVNETDIVVLSLPDFAAFDLFYNISSPFESENKWETTYDDAGVYTIAVTIWDNREFKAVKTFKILVENVDRPANPLSENTYWISENEQLIISLNYTDPDGDAVKTEVGGLPRGAKIERDELIWTPSYEYVTKENFIDDIAKNFHAMSRTLSVQVNATSSNLRLTQPLHIRVFDSNLPPVLEPINDITVTEGEAVYFNLSSFDPDNDTISYSFDGIINKDGYQTAQGDAGTYYVTVWANDGFLKTQKRAKITVLAANSPPVIDAIEDHQVNEGEVLEISLRVQDTENDKISYSTNPVLDGSYFQGSTFIWKPSHEVASQDNPKIIDLEFFAKDDAGSTSQKTSITVNDVKRPFSLTLSSQIDGETFYVGDEIPLFVEVFNPDNLELTYRWKISLFNSIEANNSLIVVYDKPGKKKVSVLVSDGEQTLDREWEFRLEKRPEVELAGLNT